MTRRYTCQSNNSATSVNKLPICVNCIGKLLNLRNMMATEAVIFLLYSFPVTRNIILCVRTHFYSDAIKLCFCLHDFKISFLTCVLQYKTVEHASYRTTCFYATRQVNALSKNVSKMHFYFRGIYWYMYLVFTSNSKTSR